MVTAFYLARLRRVQAGLSSCVKKGKLEIQLHFLYVQYEKSKFQKMKVGRFLFITQSCGLCSLEQGIISLSALSIGQGGEVMQSCLITCYAIQKMEIYMKDENIYSPPKSNLVKSKGDEIIVHQLKNQSTWRLFFLTVITLGIYIAHYKVLSVNGMWQWITQRKSKGTNIIQMKKEKYLELV